MPEFAYMVPVGTGNPEWANPERTKINITVVFPHLSGEEVRYTAAKEDPAWRHAEEIFERAAAGDFGPVADFAEMPPAVPFDVSRAQFCRGMRKRGIFTQADAVGFLGTQIPAAFSPIIASLPSQDERDDAELLVIGATRIERNHPVTALIATGLGWSPADTDEFFRECAAL